MRLIRRLQVERPPEVIVRLAWAPAEAAQVDFGAGPMLTHEDGHVRRTWAPVVTLAHTDTNTANSCGIRRWPRGLDAIDAP